MTMAGIWFERAWARWQTRKAILKVINKDFEELKPSDNLHLTSIIHALHSVPHVLNVNVRQHKENRWRLKFTVSINRFCGACIIVCDEVHAVLKKMLPAGFVGEINFEMVTP